MALVLGARVLVGRPAGPPLLATVVEVSGLLVLVEYLGYRKRELVAVSSVGEPPPTRLNRSPPPDPGLRLGSPARRSRRRS
jgi:hypothetical protein